MVKENTFCRDMEKSADITVIKTKGSVTRDFRSLYTQFVEQTVGQIIVVIVKRTIRGENRDNGFLSLGHTF